MPRLMAAGADLDRVHRFDVVNDEDEEVILSLPFDNSVFESEIVDNEAGLVVIDPLMSVIGEKIDTHRERDVRMAFVCWNRKPVGLRNWVSLVKWVTAPRVSQEGG